MATFKMFKLRPLLRQPFLTQQRLSSTAPQRKTSDPLRILFCGSDEFSAASLSALALEHTRNPSLIHSIDVLVRPPKPTGRGLTILREVPLQSVAESLSLPVHAVDTFTGWQPPLPYNLIVAVSFGLFVPPRILRSAAYGGLNVHPSLLPDLRGPAPLHHALLLGRTHTGVSLQTLSEESFDSGEVLAQTPLPGFPIAKGMKVPALRDMLAALGARMLVDGLRAGVHVPPRKDVGWTPTEEEREGIAHAPKITKKDAEIRWDAWMPETMALRARVLGDALWSRAVARDGRTKRVILSGVEEVPLSERPVEVARYFEGGRDERMAMKEQGVVRFVAWSMSGGEQDTAGEEGTGGPRGIFVPYFKDVGVEGAVVIPFAGGDCVRVRGIKLEGEQAVSNAFASNRFKRISYTAEEVRKLKDNPRNFGAGDSRAAFFGVDAIGSSVLGLLDGILD